LQSLRYLEPFGQGNPEPVFAAQAVRLMAPPRVLKDRHLKLKLAAPLEDVAPASRRKSWERPVPVIEEGNAPDPTAILTGPRCHPDAAAFRRDEVKTAIENREHKTENWRRAITFDALAWRMAERVEQEKLLAGDTLDIAFTIGNNDHPEYGGLELTVCDFKARTKVEAAQTAPGQAAAAKISSAS
jgi:RecJ OB domain